MGLARLSLPQESVNKAHFISMCLPSLLGTCAVGRWPFFLVTLNTASVVECNRTDVNSILRQEQHWGLLIHYRAWSLGKCVRFPIINFPSVPEKKKKTQVCGLLVPIESDFPIAPRVWPLEGEQSSAADALACLIQLNLNRYNYYCLITSVQRLSMPTFISPKLHTVYCPGFDFLSTYLW